MDSNIRNIIFDWGGVLIDVSMSRFLENCAARGILFEDGEITSTHKAGFFLDYETGFLSNEELREEIRRRSSCHLSDSDIDGIWNTMRGSVPEEKLRLLDSLRGKYNLYLLSNTNPLHWESASPVVFSYNGLGVDDFFRKVFLSYEMHVAKPDSRIFTMALEEAGLRPEESLFIDDSLVNCRAAESVGMKAAHYVPGEDLASIFK